MATQAPGIGIDGSPGARTVPRSTVFRWPRCPPAAGALVHGMDREAT